MFSACLQVLMKKTVDLMGSYSGRRTLTASKSFHSRQSQCISGKACDSASQASRPASASNNLISQVRNLLFVIILIVILFISHTGLCLWISPPPALWSASPFHLNLQTVADIYLLISLINACIHTKNIINYISNLAI